MSGTKEDAGESHQQGSSNEGHISPLTGWEEQPSPREWGTAGTRTGDAGIDGA